MAAYLVIGQCGSSGRNPEKRGTPERVVPKNVKVNVLGDRIYGRRVQSEKAPLPLYELTRQ